MGVISDSDYTADNYGRISLASISAPTHAAQPDNILTSLERLLSNPMMKPVVEQGARLIGEYANKLSLDNQTRLTALQQKQQNNQPEQIRGNKVMFGAGSDEN